MRTQHFIGSFEVIMKKFFNMVTINQYANESCNKIPKETLQLDYDSLKWKLIEECSRYQYTDSTKNELKNNITTILQTKKRSLFDKIIDSENTELLYNNLSYYLRNNYDEVAQFNEVKLINDNLLEYIQKELELIIPRVFQFMTPCDLVKSVFKENQMHFLNYAIDEILGSIRFRPYYPNDMFYYGKKNEKLYKTLFNQLLFLIRKNIKKIELDDLVIFRNQLELTERKDSSFDFLNTYISEISILEHNHQILSKNSRKVFNKPKVNANIIDFICSYLVRPSTQNVADFLESKKNIKPLQPKIFNHLAHVLLLLEEKQIVTRQELKKFCKQNKILKSNGVPSSYSNLRSIHSQLNPTGKKRKIPKHSKIDSIFDSIINNS